jgi:2,4-dienoyl-CoA reductase-like NADH-dependent reductase (Old Yellow Enzyme family)
MEKLFTPYRLGSVTLRNRTVRSAAFESMGADYGPTGQLKDSHVSVARGGIGMTTLAYASVARSGLSFRSQLWMRPEIVPALRDITDAIHAEGAAASIQLGHCGNMTHFSTAGQIPLGASSGVNLYSPTIVRRARREELQQIARDFGTAVRLAHEAGFDCVEIHAGHGYFISQFLSPLTTRRRDEFGGSLAGRMRFMRMCLEEVMRAREETGIGVLVKHNMYDCLPREAGGRGLGIQIPESIEIARVIESYGVDGIVLSGGFVSRTPMLVMRGAMPIRTLTYYMKSPLLKVCIRLFGWAMMRPYPWSECYFLEDALRFRAALKGPLVYVGGVVSREGAEKVLDAGFELVQMARALVAEPGFVARMEAGGEDCRSVCDHTNYCIGRMYSVDMQCYRNCPNLPKSLRREVGSIKN